MNRILKVKENVMKGLNEEGKKVENTESHLVSINKAIKLKIENCFDKLNNTKNTYFIEKFLEINKI